MSERRYIPPSGEAIYTALDRLKSGTGAKGSRFGGLDITSAASTLKTAVEELLDLRAEHRELLCPRCVKVTKYSPEQWQGIDALTVKTCVACGSILQVYSHAQLRALRARVLELELEVEKLQAVITAAFGFED